MLTTFGTHRRMHSPKTSSLQLYYIGGGIYSTIRPTANFYKVTVIYNQHDAITINAAKSCAFKSLFSSDKLYYYHKCLQPHALYDTFACTLKFIPSDAMFSDTPFQYLLQVCQFRMTWPLWHTDVMVIHEP